MSRQDFRQALLGPFPVHIKRKKIRSDDILFVITLKMSPIFAQDRYWLLNGDMDIGLHREAEEDELRAPPGERPRHERHARERDGRQHERGAGKWKHRDWLRYHLKEKRDLISNPKQRKI